LESPEKWRILYHALLFGACGYALIRGKADARIVALVFLIGKKAMDANLLPLAYAAALRFWSYPILIILRSEPGASIGA